MLSFDRKRLPSTASLTAFEAAARFGSFSEAAKDLSLTQGAISRQVKALEDHLGLQLFKRSAQRVALTEEGRAVAIQIRSILAQIQISMEQISTGGPATLVIGVLPTLATRWLIPRLPDFCEAHPNINLELITFRREFEASAAGFDAILTLGTQARPDIISYKIGDEDFVAFASPGLIEAHAISSAADLADMTLLVENTRPDIWSKWFHANGFGHHVHKRFMKFNHFDMVIAAGVQGLGIGLAPRLLIEADIRAGNLSALDMDPLTIGTAYFLSYSAQKADYPPLLLFRNWLLTT